MATTPQKPGSERLAQRLRNLRGSLTQEQAAVQADVSLSTWQNIERCKTRVQPAILRRISKEFAVSFDELWELATSAPQPVDERFTDAELERLAARLAPMIARHLKRQLD